MEFLLPPESCESPYSVSDVNRAVSDMISEGSSVVWVTGEVTSYKAHSSGHSYFRLKDRNSQIHAVIWKGNRSKSSTQLKEGMQITAIAIVRVYERGGYYQLDVQKFVGEGAGDLAKKLEELKNKLHGEGLFALDRKRPLPTVINRVGVVTAKTGAALHDIINVIHRNAPHIDIVLASAVVQGPNAPASLVKALQELNESGGVDVIIFGRGGGSAEDLYCFNDERVVRAVVASDTMVVAAIGHEVDTSLTDFAADLRAPTPSAAAEMIIKSHIEQRSRFIEKQQQFKLLAKLRITTPFQLLQSHTATKVFRVVASQIRDARMALDLAQAQLGEHLMSHINQRKQHLAEKLELLDALSPLTLLAKGYSVVHHKGTVLKSIKTVNVSDEITVKLSDGEITARVTKSSKSTGAEHIFRAKKESK